MKKNYIDRLKEYDGRTSLSSKRSLYSRKFIKNCYQENKENIQPTRTTSEKARNSHSQKRFKEGIVEALVERQKAEKENQSEEQPQIEINPYACELHPAHLWRKLYLVESSEGRRIACEQCSLAFLSKTVFLERGEAREESERLTDLKIQLVKLQRLLQQKVQSESQNCREYYRCLRGQLQIMQSQSISYIRQSYLRSKKAIEQSNEYISNYFISPKYQGDPSPVNFSEIQIELALVKLNDSAFQNARKHLRQLDLRTLAFLPHANPPLTNEKDYSTKSTKPKYDCSLSCSERIEKEQEKGLDEISFHCSRFVDGWETDLIGLDGCAEVSPSFKLF